MATRRLLGYTRGGLPVWQATERELALMDDSTPQPQMWDLSNVTADNNDRTTEQRAE